MTRRKGKYMIDMVVLSSAGSPPLSPGTEITRDGAVFVKCNVLRNRWMRERDREMLERSKEVVVLKFPQQRKESTVRKTASVSASRATSVNASQAMGMGRNPA